MSEPSLPTATKDLGKVPAPSHADSSGQAFHHRTELYGLMAEFDEVTTVFEAAKKVRDAGFTEIAPGSCTVVADHPALR